LSADWPGYIKAFRESRACLKGLPALNGRGHMGAAIPSRADGRRWRPGPRTAVARTCMKKLSMQEPTNHGPEPRGFFLHPSTSMMTCSSNFWVTSDPGCRILARAQMRKSQHGCYSCVNKRKCGCHGTTTAILITRGLPLSPSLSLLSPRLSPQSHTRSPGVGHMV